MKDLELIYYLLIIAFILDRTVFRKRRHRKGSNTKKKYNSNLGIFFPGDYQRASFLTQREYKQYFVLKEIADSKNLIVCPKVRLLDIVEPRYGVRNRQALMSKVMSKHVDFVICTADMRIYAIVELDDSTHLRTDRMQRDAFVDTVLGSVGYPVIHTYAISSDIFDRLPPV